MPHRKSSKSSPASKSSRKKPLSKEVRGPLYGGVRMFDASGNRIGETRGPSNTLKGGKAKQNRFGSHSPLSRMP